MGRTVTQVRTTKRRSPAIFRTRATVTFLCFGGGGYSLIMLRSNLKKVLSTAGVVKTPIYTMFTAVDISRLNIVKSSLRRVTRGGTKVVGPKYTMMSTGRGRGIQRVLGGATRRGNYPFARTRPRRVVVFRSSCRKVAFSCGRCRGVRDPLTNRYRERGLTATLRIVHYLGELKCQIARTRIQRKLSGAE